MQSLREMICTSSAPTPDGRADGKHGTHNDHRGLPRAWLCTWGRHPGGKLYHALFSHRIHPVPQLMNVHKAACASSQDTQALSCASAMMGGRPVWMINPVVPLMNVGSRGWNGLQCRSWACCMSESESWMKSWETIGRQKCGKVPDYDREPRCSRGNRGERVSEEEL